MFDMFAGWCGVFWAARAALIIRILKDIHRHVRVALRFRVLHNRFSEASKDSGLPISTRRRMPPMILVPRGSAYFVCVLHLNETLELFDCI